ncbi:hypothetical protein CERSUDRAFT_121238 [Gelatoporia subvermispora B]|uniref:SET domain-containing protein n=1 Tax=Ceriporiopsis subvermispora (strain B) TaxID=914234 RepID=M2RNS6_CERS8|nr:hypothetical protein CERSUDRAFT_121238 [Gelatoporia subvermispora B]
MASLGLGLGRNDLPDSLPPSHRSTQGARPPLLDVSLPPEAFAHRIEEYKAWSEEDRKIPPGPAPRINRMSLLYQHIGSHEQAKSLRQQGMMHTTIRGFPKHSSATALHELQKLTFAEMQIRKTHVPDYINELLPIGTVFLIREPTYKPATMGPFPILRIDSPSDIYFADPRSNIFRDIVWRTGPFIPGAPALDNTVESWKAKGNALFQASHWLPAAFAYSRGLYKDRGATILRLNRAEVYLRLGFFTAAAADAALALGAPGITQKQRDKALYRLARAEYGRGRYEVALQKFNEYQSRHIDDAEAAACVSRTKKRIAESITGDYDWCELFRASKITPHVEAADYHGPIMIRQCVRRGGGRGMFATRDVAPGELLLVSKPFVAVYAQDLSPNTSMCSIDLISSKIGTTTDAANMQWIIQKLYGNPDLHDAVFGLYAGPSHPSPPSSYTFEPTGDPVEVDPLIPTIDIDVSRLEAIRSYNGFAPLSLAALLQERDTDDERPPAGFYLLPSLFNHSCAPSAAWHCIGDLMVIRALQPIKAEDEITITYSLNPSFVDRSRGLQAHMISKCDCWRCEEERNDGEVAINRREALIASFEKRRQTSASRAVDYMRTFKQTMATTYAAKRGPVRPDYFFVLRASASAIRSLGRPDMLPDVISENINALISLGYIVKRKLAKKEPKQRTGDIAIETKFVPSVIDQLSHIMTMLDLTHDCLVLHDEGSASSWMSAALWATYGGGKDFFLAVLCEKLAKRDLEEFAGSVL